MSVYGDKSHVVLLKCEGAGPVSAAAAAVVEGMMKSVIYDFGDILAEDISEGWMDESYATKAHGVLEDKDPGESKEWVSCDNLRFTTLEDAVEASSIEAENLMTRLMAQNHHVLETLSSGWVIDDVNILKRLPNLWVVQINGSRFPY